MSITGQEVRYAFAVVEDNGLMQSSNPLCFLGLGDIVVDFIAVIPHVPGEMVELLE